MRRILVGALIMGGIVGGYAGVAHAAQVYDLASSTSWTYRILGETNSSLGTTMYVGDLDNDGKNDLIIGAHLAGHNGRVDSGSVYVIYNALLNTFSSSSGPTINLSSPSNYNLRIDAAGADDRLFVGSTGRDTPAIGDLNGDGKKELTLGAYLADNNSRSNSGSVYVLDGTLLDNYSGTGNVLDLASSTSYNLRIDGGAAEEGLGTIGEIADLNGDGEQDLLLGAAFADYNGKNRSGSVYVLFNSLAAAYSGTGNVLDLASSTSYNMRYDGAVAGDFVGATAPGVGNFIGTAAPDLILVGSFAGNNSRPFSGSEYIIPDSLLDDYSGTGNIIFLSSSTNYAIRYDGAHTEAEVSYSNIFIQDVNSNGKNDLVLGSNFDSNNSRQYSGSMYVVYDSLLDDYSGTGNLVDLLNPSSFNIRLDGAETDHYFSDGGIEVGDFNGDGKIDLSAGARAADPFGRSAAGQLYIIYNDRFGSLSGTGNTLDLTSPANYDVLYYGATVDDQLVDPTLAFVDVNNDGSRDILVSAAYDGFTGVLYVIYNFPHVITASSSFTSFASSSYILAGSVNASSSLTTIADVQYQIDSNNPSSGWTSCTATDGTFNSTSTEGFSCAISGLSAGSHTIYTRAKDINNAYTAQSRYASTTLTIGVSPVSAVSATPHTGGVTIDWTTVNPASTIVEYGSASGIYTASTTESDISPRVTSHSASISLACPASYYYRVRSKDAAGNEAISSEGQFTVSACTTIFATSGGGGGSSLSFPVATSTPPGASSGGSLPKLSLQDQINALMAQIRSLTAQIIARGGSPDTTTPVCTAFTRDLTVGSTGSDVMQLQKFLNANGYVVATSGAGSVGNESTYFGAKTKAALAKWQAAKGISPAVGYFGPKTRAMLNAILSSGACPGASLS